MVLNVVSLCFSFVWDFMKISQTVFDLQSGHEYMVEMAMLMFIGQDSKVGKPELQFMCSACRHMVLYICVTFREISGNGIRVMGRTRVNGRNGYVQCSKGNTSKRRQTRVTGHVFWTLSHNALHWCEVSWKYLKWYQSYGADTKLWSAEEQADRHSIFQRV